MPSKDPVLRRLPFTHSETAFRNLESWVCNLENLLVRQVGNELPGVANSLRIYRFRLDSTNQSETQIGPKIILGISFKATHSIWEGLWRDHSYWFTPMSGNRSRESTQVEAQYLARDIRVSQTLVSLSLPPPGSTPLRWRKSKDQKASNTQGHVDWMRNPFAPLRNEMKPWLKPLFVTLFAGNHHSRLS